MAFCLKRLKPKISDLQFHSVLNVGDPTLSFISPRRNEGFSRRRRNSKGLEGGCLDARSPNKYYEHLLCVQGK